MLYIKFTCAVRSCALLFPDTLTLVAPAVCGRVEAVCTVISLIITMIGQTKSVLLDQLYTPAQVQQHICLTTLPALVAG